MAVSWNDVECIRSTLLASSLLPMHVVMLQEIKLYDELVCAVNLVVIRGHSAGAQAVDRLGRTS